MLEHGKPHERTSIIKKLTGQIVQMSQQKFASNVIEKCLTFGTPVERQTLVNEMLGSTDENEPLQVWQSAMCMLALNVKNAFKISFAHFILLIFHVIFFIGINDNMSWFIKVFEWMLVNFSYPLCFSYLGSI